MYVIEHAQKCQYKAKCKFETHVTCVNAVQHCALTNCSSFKLSLIVARSKVACHGTQRRHGSDPNGLGFLSVAYQDESISVSVQGLKSCAEFANAFV